MFRSLKRKIYFGLNKIGGHNRVERKTIYPAVGNMPLRINGPSALPARG